MATNFTKLYSPRGEFYLAVIAIFLMGAQATIKPCHRPLRDIESYLKIFGFKFISLRSKRFRAV